MTEKTCQSPDDDKEQPGPEPFQKNQSSRPFLPSRTEIIGDTPWIEVFSKLATVAVLILAVWQYYEAGQDKKRERSLQLVAEWFETGQPEHLAQVSEYLFSAAQESQFTIAALPETMRERAWKNAENNTFGALISPYQPLTMQTRKNIDKLFRFFVRLEICLSSRLCDKPVARDYFLVEAQSLSKELTPFISRMRSSGYPNYGKAVESFVETVKQ